MNNQRAALLLGASGSVGNALLRAVCADGAFDPVVILSRRAHQDAPIIARDTGRTLREQLVPDMRPSTLEAATRDALRDVDDDAVGFSVLGVGAKTAKLTIDEHRAVDVRLNEAFAKGLRDSGKVRHFALMTSVGADPTAKETGSGAAGMSRYARVKGESEEAARAAGPDVVSIFRPAMIIGSQHTPWILEKTLPLFSFLTPARFHAITVDEIARAMVAAAKRRPITSAVYHYPEMMQLVAQDVPSAIASFKRG